MRNRPLAERLLSLATDDPRAAALYGDLEELCSTRGPLWFWTAYLRTLISLTWRTPVAFAVGIVSLTALNQLWDFYMGHVQFAWRTSHHPYLNQAAFYLALQFWFLIPFVMMRYGLRDRLARIGLLFLFIATGIVLRLPLLSPFLAILALAAIAISVSHPNSRRPAIMLLITSSIGAFALLNLQFLAHMACWIDEHKPLNASSHYRFFDTGFAFSHTLFWVVVWTMTLLNMLVTASVCSRLRNRFMEPPHRTGIAV